MFLPKSSKCQWVKRKLQNKNRDTVLGAPNLTWGLVHGWLWPHAGVASSSLAVAFTGVNRLSWTKFIAYGTVSLSSSSVPGRGGRRRGAFFYKFDCNKYTTVGNFHKLPVLPLNNMETSCGPVSTVQTADHFILYLHRAMSAVELCWLLHIKQMYQHLYLIDNTCAHSDCVVPEKIHTSTT